VHGCLITVAGLLLYGASLGVRAARAAAAAAVALGRGAGKSGGDGGAFGDLSSFWTQ